MITIAVTGGIGAGKSFVAELLRIQGFAVIDADQISHKIIEKGQKAYEDIIRLFGDSILDSQKNIHRKSLAKIVFSDTEKLRLLNQITHPYIFDEMQRRIEEYEKQNKDVCLDVPLLFQADFPLSYDASIAVIAPLALRIERIIHRDGCTKEEAEKRMRTQLTDDLLKEYADFVIYNDKEQEVLKEQIQKILYCIKEGRYAKKKIQKKT